MKALAERDVRLAFLNGNRDFLLGKEFCRQAGMRLVDQPHVIDLYGTPTVLLHGDQLCTRDVQYQRYRQRISNPQWQARMLSRPVWFRRSLAALLRSISRRRSRRSFSEDMDVVDTEAEALFQSSAAERMIHGHTHRPARHNHRVGGTRRERIVLGDWYTQGSVLTVTPGSTSLDTL